MLRCACSAEPTEATPGHFGCLKYAPTYTLREIVNFNIQLSNYLDDVTHRQRLLQKLSTLSDDNLNDLLHVKSMHMSENVHWSICYPNAFEHQTSQDLQTGIMHNHADMHSATMTSFIHQRNQTIPYIRIPELRSVKTHDSPLFDHI